jgi:hypothetical protein
LHKWDLKYEYYLLQAMKKKAKNSGLNITIWYMSFRNTELAEKGAKFIFQVD